MARDKKVDSQIYEPVGLVGMVELAGNFVAGKLPCECKNRTHATVVGLYGDLGSGKTSFTQGVAQAFGVKDYITSPTFVLEKIYKLPKSAGYEHLIHIDAYRLQGGHELHSIGWNEIHADSKNIIFIEWPDIVEDALPRDMIRIYFEHADENSRRVKIVC